MPISAVIIFFLTFPVLAIYLCYKFPVINKIGVVLICYIVGMTIGNIGIFPAEAAGYQKTISEVAVALSLPLLLFSMDVKRWAGMAGKALLCMGLAVISIIIVSVSMYFVLRGNIPELWKLVGMANGVYTGGTPNLVAIKAALGVDNNTFIIMHTYDTVISLIFIIFCITVAQRFFNLYLPAFDWSKYGSAEAAEKDIEAEDIHSYSGIFKPRILIPLFGAFLLSGVIVAGADRLGSLVHADYNTAVVILAITSMGILFSFVPRIRAIEKTFQLGMYIIYVFCLTVGSMANVRSLININWYLLLFIVVCIFGTMLLQSLLCRIFKIDTDTFIITTVSAICSPPFVPPVAAGLKNKMVLLTGITTGIIGYAIGNYLGISIAYALKYFFE